MTGPIVPPVDPANSLHTGGFMETAGIEPAQDSPRARPERQRTRSRSNCDCGGPCFYCDRVLSRGRHEHDHFPIPARHGGGTTVPACLECHSLKDRRFPIGLHRDGSVDTPIFKAIVSGLESVPEDTVSVVFRLFMGWRAATSDGALDWNGGPWLADDVEGLSDRVAGAVPLASTPEARIWVAWMLTAYLDAIDAALSSGWCAEIHPEVAA